MSQVSFIGALSLSVSLKLLSLYLFKLKYTDYVNA